MGLGRDSKGRMGRLCVVGAVLTAVVVAPMAGSASTGGSPFGVKATDGEVSNVYAIAGLSKDKGTTPTPGPSTEPTTPVTTPPVTSPEPTTPPTTTPPVVVPTTPPTVEPTTPPTTAPVPDPTPVPDPVPAAPTVVYASNFVTTGSKPAEWQMQKEAGWRPAVVLAGAVNRSPTVGQNDFPNSSGELKLKLTKQLEAGSYSVKFKYNLDTRVGSKTALPYWMVTVNGVQTKKTIPYTPGVYTEVTLDGIVVPSGGASELIFTTGKGTLSNYNLYTIGDVVVSKVS